MATRQQRHLHTDDGNASQTKANSDPAVLYPVQGEQHGFRAAASIRSALEGEMFFYGKVLGFNAAYDPTLQPIVIDNLPTPT